MPCALRHRMHFHLHVHGLAEKIEHLPQTVNCEAIQLGAANARRFCIVDPGCRTGFSEQSLRLSSVVMICAASIDRRYSSSGFGISKSRNILPLPRSNSISSLILKPPSVASIARGSDRFRPWASKCLTSIFSEPRGPPICPCLFAARRRRERRRPVLQCQLKHARAKTVNGFAISGWR